MMLYYSILCDPHMILDYPTVGLLHGNNLDNAGFTVLLPNGVTCPDHPIPALPFFSPQTTDQPDMHGMVEIDGILYMGGGKLADSTPGSQYQCYVIDLKPIYTAISSM